MTREAKVLRDKAARAFRQARNVKQDSQLFKEIAESYKRLALLEKQRGDDAPRLSKSHTP
jgi:hypothetical protein